MTNSTEKIHIVLATDDNYAKYCAATISSILSNTQSNQMCFHILTEDLTEKNLNKISDLKKIKSCDIFFHKIDSTYINNLPLNRNWISKATYYRLLILDILPDYIDKIIYLDCDVIVQRDIKELWDIDLSDYMIGAVEDEMSIDNHKRLSLSDKHIYFNAGVLLLNLEKLRTFNFKEKCVDYYTRNSDKITMQDQDILNGVFDGYCLQLPLCWNVNSIFYHIEVSEAKHYWKSNDNEATINPGIIHFTGSMKAWDESTVHPYKELFWKYLSHTSYKSCLFKHWFSRILQVFFRKRKIVGAYVEEEYSILVLGIKLYSKIKKNNSKEIYILGIKIKD